MRQYNLILSLIVFVMVLPLTFVSGQERINPKLKYEYVGKEMQEKGCGCDLNEDGLELQDKGLDLFFVTGKTKDAVKLLEQAIELEPRLFKSYLQLCFYYVEVENNPKKTVNLLKKGIEQCPKVPLLYSSLGDSYAQMEQHQDAIFNYNKAEELGIDPYPPFYFNRGNSYTKLKEYDKAIENYKKALSLDSKHFKAWQNLIIVYYYKGDTQKALEYASELERLDSNGKFGVWAKEVIREIKAGR